VLYDRIDQEVESLQAGRFAEALTFYSME